MDFTWEALRGQIGRKLSDPDHRKYSPGLLVDCVNDALVSFASAHTGVPRELDLTGDGERYQFALPPDVVCEEGAGVYAVRWNENSWLVEDKYWQGYSIDGQRINTSSKPIKYLMWPAGAITFTRVPTSGQTVRLYYVGYYDEIIDDSSFVNVPIWAREAIKLYSASCAIEPQAIKASNLGQFKSRREAGHPEHNPMLREAEHMMRRYWEILRSHAAPQYKLLTPAGR